MNYIQHNSIANFIWGIADDVLRIGDCFVLGTVLIGTLLLTLDFNNVSFEIC